MAHNSSGSHVYARALLPVQNPPFSLQVRGPIQLLSLHYHGFTDSTIRPFAGPNSVTGHDCNGSDAPSAVLL